MIPYEDLASALTQWRAEREGGAAKPAPSSSEIFADDIVESAPDGGEPSDFEEAD